MSTLQKTGGRQNTSSFPGQKTWHSPDSPDVTIRLGSLPLPRKDGAANSAIMPYFDYDMDTLYLDTPPEGCFDAVSFLLLQAIPADRLAIIRNFAFNFYSPWSEMRTSLEEFAKQRRHLSGLQSVTIFTSPWGAEGLTSEDLILEALGGDSDDITAPGLSMAVYSATGGVVTEIQAWWDAGVHHRTTADSNFQVSMEIREVGVYDKFDGRVK